jgi:hypothetical protein
MLVLLLKFSNISVHTGAASTGFTFFSTLTSAAATAVLYHALKRTLLYTLCWQTKYAT